jgi:hypothetical protein
MSNRNINSNYFYNSACNSYKLHVELCDFMLPSRCESDPHSVTLHTADWQLVTDSLSVQSSRVL